MNGVTETERRRQERGLAVSLFESIREEDAVNARLPSKMKDEADLEIGCRETSKEHPLPSRFGRPFTTVARTVFANVVPRTMLVGQRTLCCQSLAATTRWSPHAPRLASNGLRKPLSVRDAQNGHHDAYITLT